MRLTFLTVLAFLVSGLPALGASEPREGVSGTVIEEKATPVEKVTVFAYEVASSRMRDVQTDERGRFSFESLPAGMYKLVAFKQGFAPTVELLLRRHHRDTQQVEIRLEADRTDDPRDGEGYWNVRGRVPADVMRELHVAYAADLASDGFQLEAPAAFKAEMRALSGVEQFGAGIGDGQWMGAEIDIDGAIGGVSMGLDGHYQELDGGLNSGFEGEVRSVAFEVQPMSNQAFRLSSQSSELAGGLAPVDIQRYQIGWTGKTGKRGQTNVIASYVEEENYYQRSAITPADIPGSSATWGVDGDYAGEISDKTHLRAGLSYRQREVGGLASEIAAEETVGLYSIAGSQVVPKVLVEYGLYSSVRDGSLSLMPHGGLVVQLGDHWQARGAAAHRVSDERPKDLFRSFRTAFYKDNDSCHEAGESCYEVMFSRGEGDRQVRIGAIHREFAETLQLYFSPDFFERLESVFVVDGDQLPEFQFSVVRRVAPKVLAKLESNIASGGGGIFYAADDASYENNIRYLVTSIDTRFQRTSTGVFVAFHHLEQAFDPVEKTREAPQKMEMQRLQLMLTQDLNVLKDLTSKWAVRLNMELSRGVTPYTLTADDELYKKLTTGLSVSF
ncbi:MAG: carboxypeptidase-like regulatory domain-containing protein [Acidobacteriota bacterium]